MIFASVGSMLPFDRFVKAVDRWAEENPGTDVMLQIGDGAYEPRFARWCRIMPHAEYARLLETCTLFVAHVGMGSILQALEMRKQMLLLPRHAKWGEHTTDHQLHTADRFRHRAGIVIVDDDAALREQMSILRDRPITATETISSYAPEEMLEKIRSFLKIPGEVVRGAHG